MHVQLVPCIFTFSRYQIRVGVVRKNPKNLAAVRTTRYLSQIGEALLYAFLFVILFVFAHSSGAIDVCLKVGMVIMKFEPFTTSNGLITQTLKTKRNVVAERFGKEIDALYASKR